MVSYRDVLFPGLIADFLDIRAVPRRRVPCRVVGACYCNEYLVERWSWNQRIESICAVSAQACVACGKSLGIAAKVQPTS